MDSYTFATALGAAGLAAMAALGVSHLGDTGQGAGHAGHGSAGHEAGHVAHMGHEAHAAHLQHVGRLRGGARGGMRSVLLSLASPRTLFSALLGFGLVGLFLRPLLGGALLAAAAVIGGVTFEAAIVRPLWNVLFRFASTPAASLEGSLMSEATATSGFDANGQGVVSLEVDGQLVQCLGTLRASDRELGVRVRAGDRLRVEEVDAVRSRCTVSYVGHEIGAR